ncbi:YggS family pyridoxal phosphate-dependent enzyme [candidate division KSB1 bacterium]|nr:YggS family pyridoxal phosphate-dependent enzyme [candidate division KSB1 bacterium]
MGLSHIYQAVKSILVELPLGVELVAAAKTRTAAEVRAAVEAGVKILGYNYVQEAQKIQHELENINVEWHFIGHLQRNKVKTAIHLFEMIETVDSYELAQIINQECQKMNKTIQVLIEVNSGRESNKSGVLPENVIDLARKLGTLPNLKLEGLMTMGPFLDDPEKIRPFFRETCFIFNQLSQLKIPDIEMKYLSMGMSDSYRVAIEEGANIVRIGTKLFGERQA